MTEFKICGIAKTEHAIAARTYGACWIGFVFVPGVRREISVEKVKDIIAQYRDLTGPGGPGIVGLFANQTLREVNSISEQCELDYVQLCGDEDDAYWSQLDFSIIRQIKVASVGDRPQIVDSLRQQVENVLEKDAIPLLDRLEKGKLGGTGQSFDWSVAAELPDDWDYMVAGGLDPSNVMDAINKLNPWAVDVSSGVETNGKKDTSKIREFANKVISIDIPK
ncbi:MAG: phosphoribosylanthranilate isomerase [Chloroflexota bacterium]|nr:phosphoribosylanthranilate isomerase [Chloroflexota bacterium]